MLRRASGGTAALALLALGCQHAALPPTATNGTPGTPAAALGAVLQQEDSLQAALGLYRLTIDTATLTGTTDLIADRAGMANDDLYLLPIANFLRPNSLKVTGVSATASVLAVDYVFAHPFAAPSNPDGTATAANRADLGVAVALVLLADQPTPTGNTYFTDRVVNTSLVTNADSYWDPGALVTTTGLNANLFPVQHVVDEAGSDGNRVGVSNGGDPTGNFGNDGWTRGELGFDNNGWTGFGILHQGQRVRNTLLLDKAAVAAAGSFSLDVAVIAKYNDPRQGATSSEKRANRLPSQIPDPTRFAYRMPHGAWDVSHVTFLGSSNIYTVGSFDASDLAFHVVDWDARAIETSVGDLGGDLDVTTVAVGEAGFPTLSVSLPGVIGDVTAVSDFAPGVLDDDSAYGGDVAADSGRPGDPLCYVESIESGPTGPAAAGIYTGLVRVIDPEVTNISDPLFIVELDGSLAPLTSDIPSPIAYQVFTVEAQVPVSSNGFALSWPASGSDEGRGLAVDSLGNIIMCGQWLTSIDFGGGPYSAGGSDWSCFLVKFSPSGGFLWDRVFGGPTTGISESARAVGVDASDNIFVTGWFRGPTDFGGGTVNSNGFVDGFVSKYTPAGALLWTYTFGSNVAGTGSTEPYDLAVDSAGNVYVTGYFSTNCTFPGGVSNASAGGFDGFNLKLNGSTGAHMWSGRFGTSNATYNTDGGQGIAFDPNSNQVYVAGLFAGTVDFGGGPESSLGQWDGFLTAYSLTGTHQWTRKMGGPQSDWCYHIGVSPTGPVTGGFYRSAATLGSGVSTSNGDADFFAVKFTSAGAFLWNWTAGGTLGDFVRTMAVDPITGAVYVGGDWNDVVDFGGGPRTEPVASGRDAALVKLNASGVYQWDALLQGSGDQAIYRLTVDTLGNPIATGIFNGTVDFDPSGDVLNLVSGGGNDVFLWKLNRDTGLF